MDTSKGVSKLVPETPFFSFSRAILAAAWPAFLLRRLVLTIPVVWIVVTLVFALIHLVPGDPVAQMLGEGAPQPEIRASAARSGFGPAASRAVQDLRVFSLLKGTWASPSAISSLSRNPLRRATRQRFS
jgi:ABC-type dipeptide/oligopeptide/nickel transport system permease component